MKLFDGGGDCEETMEMSVEMEKGEVVCEAFFSKERFSAEEGRYAINTRFFAKGKKGTFL